MTASADKGFTRRGVMKGAAAGLTAVASPFVLRTISVAASSQITVMNTFPTLANEYWQAWDAGAKGACQQLGLKYISQTFADSVEKQISQIEQAGSLGVNAVVTFAQNAEIIKALANTAKQSNIILANVHSTALWLDPLDPSYGGSYALYTQPDNVRSVAAICQVLFDKIGGEGDILYVAGLPGNFSAETRRAGLMAALAKNPKIKLVAEQNGGENRVAARPVVENLLTAHPNVKAIVSYNADTAIAVLDVLRDRGLSGQVYTVAVDETKEMLTRIQSDPSALGTVGIVAPFSTGYSVVTLYDMLQGVTFDPLEAMRYTDSLLIDTPEAATAMLKHMEQPEAMFDFKAMSRHLNPDNWVVQSGVRAIDPTTFWAGIPMAQASKPADLQFPSEVEASLKAGHLDTINAAYASHFKAGPLADVVALTRTKKTVLGS
jgi:ABC-type sugar transport system substrate-binding protein